MPPLSLQELNSLVRGTLEATLADTYWLVAELSEVRPAANGHCYLEFVEKAPRSNALVAKASGVIWRNVYGLLAAHFERTTGQRLQPGMKVLVQVSVSFHELYGYSLQVSNIDPTYTLGDVARRRQEIIDALTEDGVLTLNKELTLPRPLSRIAVISSATAAGYGDFCRQLEESGFGFTTKLFSATMQGEQVEQSVIAALNAVAEEMENWDAVAIIRGGGAVSDLNGFDTYLLAANVAQFPLPVLTGIGHERDETVLDLVAHTRLKTPTAVAAFLIETRRDETAALDLLKQRLLKAVNERMESERLHYTQIGTRFQMAATHYGSRQREQLTRLSTRMELHAKQQLQAARNTLEHTAERLPRLCAERFMLEHHRLELFEKTIHIADPARILSLGFSITLKDGKPIRNAKDLKPGDTITTRLAKGEVRSVVEK